MKIRLFDIDTDFDTIKDWVADGRTHVMWSANRMVYPLDRKNLQQVLTEMQDNFAMLYFDSYVITIFLMLSYI